MASSATILSVDAADGDWHGYGTAGCYLVDSPADVVDLPAWVSAVDLEVASDATIRSESGAATGVDGVAIDAAATGRSTTIRYANPPADLDITTADWIPRADPTSRYFVSLRLWNNFPLRLATLTVLSEDGATVLDGPSSALDTNAGHGYWARVYCTGPVRLRITGRYAMSQGILLDLAPAADAPGRLCALDGQPGLA